MRRWPRILLATLALAASPILLLQGLANARVTPFLLDWNPYWLAEMSSAFMTVDQSSGQPVITVSEQGVALARGAFASEPLASDALFLLAVDQRSRGGDGEAARFIEQAAGFDKRNRNLGILQLELSARDADLEQTFAVVNRLSTVHPTLTMNFVRPITSALASDDAVPALHEALEERPAWASAFWQQVPGTADAVGRMYRLRQMTTVGTTPDSDGLLLAALVQQQRFEEVFAFWEQISGEEAGETAFVAGTQYAPVGWQLTSTGDRSMTATGDNGFDIYVAGQTSGELARQLVRIAPGNYVLRANVTPADAAPNIEASLQCASSDAGEEQRRSLGQDVRWAVAAPCEVYWLALQGSAWEGRSALRARVSDISFTSAD